jgi:hypothetical protein
MTQYQYLILRYVHNASTEEFVNIGILMWLPEQGRLLHDISEKYTRLSNFFEGFDGANYRNMIRHLKAKLRGAEEQTYDRIQSVDQLVDAIFPRDPSCFQWSSAMGGVTPDPEQRLRKIFDRIVDRHVGRHERTRRDEKDIYQNLIARLQQRHLVDRLERDVPVKGEHFDYTFKLGWQNGKPQYLEPISFDYTKGGELIEKAYAWSGRLSDLSKGRDFSLTSVVAPPQQENLRRHYQEALKILKESPTVRKVIEENEIEKFMPEIEHDLATDHG